MSLDTLVNTVSIKMNCAEETVLHDLLCLADIIGHNDFTIRTLKARGFINDDVKTLLKVLCEYDLITENIKFECELSGYTGVTKSLTDICEGCGSRIMVAHDDHVFESIFSVNDEFSQLIKDFRKKQLKLYIQEDYHGTYRSLILRRNEIIPFLGAGIATAWGLPTWKQLLEGLCDKLPISGQNIYKTAVQEGDFFRALDILKNQSLAIVNDDQLKHQISRILNERRTTTPIKDHNYSDIVALRSRIYLTTNYDTTLTDFAHSNFGHPLTLADIENIQGVMRGQHKRVIHLHGLLDRPSTMIVSSEDYKKLYQSEQFKVKLATIMSRPLLFIGFSFKDKFFDDLYSSIVRSMGGEHFIIATNVHPFEAREWANRNLYVIGVNVPKDTDGKLVHDKYVRAIRTILSELK